MTRIVTLEDDFELARTWRRALEACGYDVEICATTNEAIALYTEREPDLCIVDLLIRVDVPDVVDNGLNFLRFIKRSSHDCKVLGVTGYRPLGSDQSARDLFKSYGVRNILTKPFDVDTLTDEVGRLLSP